MYILAHMPLALRDDDQNDEIRAAYVLNEQSQNNENLFFQYCDVNLE